MKQILGLLLALSCSTAIKAQFIVDEEVSRAFEKAEGITEGYLPVGLIFHAQYNFDSLAMVFEARQAPFEERVPLVIAEGIRFSENSQAAVLPLLEGLAQKGLIRELNSLWLCNGVFFKMRPEAIPALQQLNPAAQLIPDLPMELASPGFKVEDLPEAPNSSEQGLRAIKAPFMWNMGYSGHGQMAYIYDSGTRNEHPALREQFIGNRFGLSQGWRSYHGNVLPTDRSDEHGTHVAGTVIGLEKATNDTIGVAPAAYFISNDLIPGGGNPQTIVQAFQFAINPDGNPATTYDVPHVINNSWGSPLNSAACNFLNGTWAALEASGIGNIWAAGNEGPGASTISLYGGVAVDSLRNFSVANLNANNPSWPINSSSSRGPTVCAPSAPLNIKPEVAGPGTNVRSSVGENGYAAYTGTSMASPHVAGAYLLLREAFLTASPRQLVNSLYQTAIDLGLPGEDNDYGRGMIDLQAAYTFLSQSFTPVPPSTLQRDLAIMGIRNRRDGDRFCDLGNEVVEELMVKNVGQQPINGFDIHYGIDNYNLQSNYAGTLQPGQQVTVPLSITGNFTALSELKVRVKTSGAPERDTVNNLFAVRMRVQDGQMPFGNRDNGRHQDFTNIGVLNSQWLINNVDHDFITWEHHMVQGLPGTSTAVKVRMNNYGPAAGQLDELLSPYFIPVGGSGNVDLHFRLAYRNRAGFNADSLFVYMSSDCQNWTRIYTDGGSSMATFTGGTEPTQAAHWRMIRVPQVLPVFTKVALKFVTRNGFGGNLYLTNISYGDVPLGLFETEAPEFKLYPNPAATAFNLQLSEAAVEREMRLTDYTGRELMRRRLEAGQTEHQISLEGLASGFYLVHVDGAGGTAVKKLVITK
ncbi:MAG: S8 family serine peptidase [Bacteroidia bacterium]